MTRHLESTGQRLMALLRWLGKGWLVMSSVIGSLVLGLILVLVLVGLLADSSSLQQPTISQKQLRAGGDSQIAVVELIGPIMDDAGVSDPFAISSSIVSAQRVNQLLDALASDAKVKAVILRMNTPGGTVVASDELYQRVVQLNQIKPVVTSIGDVAASGGYYIAAGGSKIVANPATITGSIGVIGQFPKLEGLYDKIGVEMRVIKSGELKDIGSPNRDMTAQEQQILESIVQDSYDQFVTAVAQGRSIDAAEVRRLADGRIYSGKQAMEVGLVDVLGNLDTAIDVAKQLSRTTNPTVIKYDNQSFFEALFESKLGAHPLKSMDALIAPQEFKLYYMLDV